MGNSKFKIGDKVKILDGKELSKYSSKKQITVMEVKEG